MTTLTLTPELEEAVLERAKLQGKSEENVALDVLKGEFLARPHQMMLPENATLADSLADYIGCIDTSEKYSEGSTNSMDMGKKFAQAMVEKHRQGKV